MWKHHPGLEECLFGKNSVVSVIFKYLSVLLLASIEPMARKIKIKSYLASEIMNGGSRAIWCQDVIYLTRMPRWNGVLWASGLFLSYCYCKAKTCKAKHPPLTKQRYCDFCARAKPVLWLHATRGQYWLNLKTCTPTLVCFKEKVVFLCPRGFCLFVCFKCFFL